MKKALTTVIVASAMLAGVARSACAAEETLLFATTIPANWVLTPRAFQPWTDKVNKEGKGVLHIDIKHGRTFANFTNYYQRVIDDVVQISWGIQSYLGDRFARSAVVGLPLHTDSSEQASVAYWRLYKTGLLDAEYKDIVPIRLFASSHHSIHLIKEPIEINDLKGIKLITGSLHPVASALRLGATPLSIGLGDSYEALKRGTADGIATTWGTMVPFKFTDVTKFHIDFGLGGNHSAMFMAKKRYDGLSAAARRVLDANRGEKESREMGALYGELDHRDRETVRRLGDQKIVKLSAEQEAKWNKQLSSVATDWAKKTPNGEKILATFDDLVAKLRKEGI